MEVIFQTAIEAFEDTLKTSVEEILKRNVRLRHLLAGLLKSQALTFLARALNVLAD